MDNQKFIIRSMEEVNAYTLAHLDKSDTVPPFDSFVVWSCKTLQNHKALLSTTLTDGMYYEVTYNGDKQEAYLDAYKKLYNAVVMPNSAITGMGAFAYEACKAVKSYIYRTITLPRDAGKSLEALVVWRCKALQNYKALVTTNIPNLHLYFEVTYNGDKEEAYLDVYKKFDNKIVMQGE